MQEQSFPSSGLHTTAQEESRDHTQRMALPADPVKGGCALQVKNLWFIAKTMDSSLQHATALQLLLSALLAQRTRCVPTLPRATDLFQGQWHLAKLYASKDHLLNTSQPKAVTCSILPSNSTREFPVPCRTGSWSKSRTSFWCSARFTSWKLSFFKFGLHSKSKTSSQVKYSMSLG